MIRWASMDLQHVGILGAINIQHILESIEFC